MPKHMCLANNFHKGVHYARGRVYDLKGDTEKALTGDLSPRMRPGIRVTGQDSQRRKTGVRAMVPQPRRSRKTYKDMPPMDKGLFRKLETGEQKVPVSTPTDTRAAGGAAPADNG